jgi:hypothetical protein
LFFTLLGCCGQWPHRGAFLPRPAIWLMLAFMFGRTLPDQAQQITDASAKYGEIHHDEN